MTHATNKATLLGRMGLEPEIKATQSGDRVATFSVATSEQWKDKTTGEKQSRTEWHNVVAYGEGLVKVIEENAKKGARVYLEGQMQTRKWAGKDGGEHSRTEVVLQGFKGTFILLDSARAKTKITEHADII